MSFELRRSIGLDIEESDEEPSPPPSRLFSRKYKIKRLSVRNIESLQRRDKSRGTRQNEYLVIVQTHIFVFAISERRRRVGSQPPQPPSPPPRERR